MEHFLRFLVLTKKDKPHCLISSALYITQLEFFFLNNSDVRKMKGCYIVIDYLILKILSNTCLKALVIFYL